MKTGPLEASGHSSNGNGSFRLQNGLSGTKVILRLPPYFGLLPAEVKCSDEFVVPTSKTEENNFPDFSDMYCVEF